MANDNKVQESVVRHRRNFLKTAGGVTAASILSGCIGGDDSSPSDGENGDDENGDSGGADDEETFPENDIRLIVPYGTGGGYDAYTRLLAPYLEEYLPGEGNIVVQNVEGAGGRVATDQVWNADPDGYTLMIVNVLTFIQNQFIYEDDVDYQIEEFTHFAQVTEDVFGLAVGANTDIHDFEDLTERIKNDDVMWGSSDLNGMVVPALTGQLSDLWPAESVFDNVVMYDGRGEIIQGTLGGDVHAQGATYWSMLPYVESDDLRMILQVSMDEEPFDPTPDIDTLLTADVPNGELISDVLTGRRTFAGPPGMSDSREEVLAEAFELAINDDDFQAEAEEAGRPVYYMGPEDTQSAVENAAEVWAEQNEILTIATEST